MIFEIPLAELPSFRQRTTLDGLDYILTFDWNEREGKYFLSVADAEDVAIISGLKLVVDFPLLYTVSDERRPTGELICSTADGVDPTLDTISQATLFYYDAEELAEI